MLRTDLDDTLDLIGLLASWPAVTAYVGVLCALVTAYVLDFAGRPRLRFTQRPQVIAADGLIARPIIGLGCALPLTSACAFGTRRAR